MRSLGSTFPQVFRAQFIGVFHQQLGHPCWGTDIYRRLQSRLNSSLISQCLGDRWRNTETARNEGEHIHCKNLSALQIKALKVQICTVENGWFRHELLKENEVLSFASLMKKWINWGNRLISTSNSGLLHFSWSSERASPDYFQHQNEFINLFMKHHFNLHTSTYENNLKHMHHLGFVSLLGWPVFGLASRRRVGCRWRFSLCCRRCFSMTRLSSRLTTMQKIRYINT